ncbi:MAG: 50S ribosomal protein L6 [Candidatus Micrarchaeia archaeon]
MIALPPDVKLEVNGNLVTVSGPLGRVEKKLLSRDVAIEVTPQGVAVRAPRHIVNTLESCIANMVKGVREGYTIKLQMLYAHFPFSVEVKGRQAIIKNFLGEKQPRVAAIAGSTKVEVKPPFVILSGVSKEDVSQTAANLRAALRIRNRDPRVFQDGLYPVEE